MRTIPTDGPWIHLNRLTGLMDQMVRAIRYPENLCRSVIEETSTLETISVSLNHHTVLN